jgi:hypothetical protein
MFSKKAKVLISTAVLTALGVAFTGVASARIGGTARTIQDTAVALRPMHDKGGEGRGGKMGGHLEAAATALGMTSDELKTALADGSSLADVAASKNVAVQTVIDAIVADEKAEIAQAVTDGKLTQAQADALQAKVVEHVTAIVNGERPAPMFGHGGPDGRGEHGGRGHHGMGDDHSEADETADA